MIGGKGGEREKKQERDELKMEGREQEENGDRESVATMGWKVQTTEHTQRHGTES